MIAFHVALSRFALIQTYDESLAILEAQFRVQAKSLRDMFQVEGSLQSTLNRTQNQSIGHYFRRMGDDE